MSNVAGRYDGNMSIASVRSVVAALVPAAFLQAVGKRPYAVYALIAANALVFLYQSTLSDLDTAIFHVRFGFIPEELRSGESFGLVGVGLPSGEAVEIDATSPIPDWATAFTMMFLHGNLMHIVGNMVLLYLFGRQVADRFGQWGFLGFYVLVGLAAATVQVLDPSSNGVTVGASGAGAGVMGAFLLLYPSIRTAMIVLAVLFPIPALLSFVGALGAGVAYNIHAGGLLAGVAVGLAVRLWTRTRATIS